VKRTEDNHARGADDTAVIEAVPYGAARPGEHSPMADHGLLGLPDQTDEETRDDLAAELAKAAPRHWWNRGTLVLGGIALILAGFLGGIQVQKNYGTAATAGAGAGRGAGAYGLGGTGRGAGAYGGTNGFPGAPGVAATTPAASGTTGTVKLVDGDTIYVQTADGTVVTVKTSGNTSVKTATTGTLKDVKAGESVTVQGAAGTDGTVTATSVTADKKK
jgi:hypothetical protein